jgi:hypothetical protein
MAPFASPVQNLQVIQEADGTWSANWKDAGVDEYQLLVNGTALSTVTATSVTGLKLNPGDVLTVTAWSFSAGVTFTVPPPPPTLKPACFGLMDRDTVSPADDWIEGVVINALWSEMQAAPGGALLPNNPLAIGRATIAAFNAAKKANRRARLRLFLGSRDPGNTSGPALWPQNLGGAPISITGNQGQSGYVGHYWMQVAIAAYADLMTKIAAEIDSDEEIAEVVVAGPMLLYAELYLRYGIPALEAAGDTLAAEIAAYAAYRQAHAAFKYTRPVVAFNPADFPGIGGVTFTIAQIAAFRAEFPSGVVMNCSWRDSDLGKDYDAMYAYMRSAGAPQSLQTAVLSKLISLPTTLENGITQGAGSIEMPSGYGATPVATLQAIQAKFAA